MNFDLSIHKIITSEDKGTIIIKVNIYSYLSNGSLEPLLIIFPKEVNEIYYQTR